MRIQLKDGDVAIDCVCSEREVHHGVMDYVAQLLSGAPEIEKLIEIYGDVELIFLIAEYYRRHQNLIGFAFPKDYEVPNFLVQMVAEGEEEHTTYHIKIRSDAPAAVSEIIGVCVGLLLGSYSDHIAFTHFAVHEMIADYIDAAYKGDEDDEDCDTASA